MHLADIDGGPSAGVSEWPLCTSNVRLEAEADFMAVASGATIVCPGAMEV